MGRGTAPRNWGVRTEFTAGDRIGGGGLGRDRYDIGPKSLVVGLGGWRCAAARARGGGLLRNAAITDDDAQDTLGNAVVRQAVRLNQRQFRLIGDDRKEKEK